MIFIKVQHTQSRLVGASVTIVAGPRVLLAILQAHFAALSLSVWKLRLFVLSLASGCALRVDGIGFREQLIHKQATVAATVRFLARRLHVVLPQGMPVCQNHVN